MKEYTTSEPETDSPDDYPKADVERIAEALIFAASEPVRAGDIAQVIADVTGEKRRADEEIDAAVKRLNQHYEEDDRGLRVNTWGGGYRMSTSPTLAPFLKAYFDAERQTRLTRSLMETLSILAYRQPVTKPEVDFVRGVDSDYAIRRLLEIGLVDVVGRSDSVGRPLLYGTTSRFLQEFGLGSLDDLPRLREIEELLGDPNFNQERAKLLALEGIERAEPREESTEQAPESGVDPD